MRISDWSSDVCSSDLAEPDYSDNARRMANRPSLNARINAVTRGKPVDHWIEAINKAGCPAGRVMGLEEVFSDPPVLAKEMVIESQRPGRVPSRMTGLPVKMSATPCVVCMPPPELGEPTADVPGGLSRVAAGFSRWWF